MTGGAVLHRRAQRTLARLLPTIIVPMVSMPMPMPMMVAVNGVRATRVVRRVVVVARHAGSGSIMDKIKSHTDAT